MTGTASSGPRRFPDLSYEVEAWGEVQTVVLPFTVGVINDHGRDSRATPDLQDRQFIQLTTANLDEVNANPGLRDLVVCAESDPGIEVKVLDFSLDDLKASFLRASDTDQSGVFKTIYEQEFGQLGGQPLGLMLLDMEFTRSANDVRLLRELADMASKAGCLFVTPVAPALFGARDWQSLAGCEDIGALFTSAVYVEWRELLQDPSSNMLVMPVPCSDEADSRETAYALTAAIVDQYSSTRGWKLDSRTVDERAAPTLFSLSQLKQFSASGFMVTGQADGELPGADLTVLLTIAEFARVLKCIARDTMGAFPTDAEALEHLNNWLREFTVRAKEAGIEREYPVEAAWLEAVETPVGVGYFLASLHVRLKGDGGESPRQATHRIRFPSVIY